MTTGVEKVLKDIYKELHQQNKFLSIIATNQRAYFDKDLMIRKIQLGIEPINSLKEGGAYADQPTTREEAEETLEQEVLYPGA